MNTTLINLESTNSRKVSKLLKDRKNTYKILKNKPSINTELKKSIKELIICGGDGTINNLINNLMKIPSKKRQAIKIKILPVGRANDLANYLYGNVSEDKILSKTRTKKLDLIKINGSYIVTGGGLGLPSEVINQTNKLKNKKIKSGLNSKIYQLMALKSVLSGYKTIKNPVINGQLFEGEFMALCILNQPFIGKKFLLSPKAKNTDGIINLTLIKKPHGKINQIRIINKIKNGQIEKTKPIFLESRKFEIQLNEISKFMGDGEIIQNNKKFKIEVIPKALNFYY